APRLPRSTSALRSLGNLLRPASPDGSASLSAPTLHSPLRSRSNFPRPAHSRRSPAAPHLPTARTMTSPSRQRPTTCTAQTTAPRTVPPALPVLLPALADNFPVDSLAHSTPHKSLAVPDKPSPLPRAAPAPVLLSVHARTSHSDMVSLCRSIDARSDGARFRP